MNYMELVHGLDWVCRLAQCARFSVWVQPSTGNACSACPGVALCPVSHIQCVGNYKTTPPPPLVALWPVDRVPWVRSGSLAVLLITLMYCTEKQNTILLSISTEDTEIPYNSSTV